jgi:HEAT repeat protein
LLAPQSQPAIPRLKEALQDPFPQVRVLAYFALKRLGANPDSILDELRNSKSVEKRVQAACTMRGVDPAVDVRAILDEGFKHADLGVRTQAACALARDARLGDKLMPTLVAGLKHESKAVRWQALVGLQDVSAFWPDAGVALVDALSHADPDIRQAAREALPRVVFAEANVGPLLEKEFKDGDAEARIAILKVQHKFAAMRTLISAGLKDTDPRVRQQALDSVSGEPKLYLPELAGLIKDKSAAVRMQLINHFCMAGDDGVPHLGELVKDPDDGVRAAAMWQLQGRETQAKLALPAIKHALKDKNHQVRVLAIGLMATVGGEKPAVVVPRLIEFLNDDDHLVRHHASLYLGRIGAEAAPALPHLRQLETEDIDLSVRIVAGDAVRRIEADRDQK